jgi:rhomboid protease GluP
MSQQPPTTNRKAHPLESFEERVQQAQQIAPQGPRRRLLFRRVSRKPYITYGLIAINVLIFIVRTLSPALDLDWLLRGANSGAAVFGAGEVWRLFTSMFLHASINDYQGGYVFGNAIHILFNMAILYSSGGTVERFFGHTRFALIYLLGGLTASFVSSAAGVALSVGASGAVLAILGAEFAFYYRHRDLLGDRGRAMRGSLIRLAIVNLIFGVLSGFGSGMRVDNWAHIGGAITGLGLAALAGARYVPVPPRGYQRLIVVRDRSNLRQSTIRLAVYAAALAALIVVMVVITPGS